MIILLAVTGTAGGSAGAAGAASVANLVSGPYAVAFWLGFVVIGLAVPFVLEFMSHRGSQSKALPMAGEACVLVGGFMLRLLVILAALPVLFL